MSGVVHRHDARMGENQRVWGDDEFWMDVVIQAVGWVLVLATIVVTALIFRSQRRNEIEDAKRDREAATEEATRAEQARVAQHVLDEVLRTARLGFWFLLAHGYPLIAATRMVGLTMTLYSTAHATTDKVFADYCQTYARALASVTSPGLAVIPLIGAVHVQRLAVLNALVAVELGAYVSRGVKLDLTHVRLAAEKSGGGALTKHLKREHRNR